MPPEVTVTTETLRKLHRIHQQLCDLKARLDRGPRLAQAHAQNIAKLEAVLATAEAGAKGLRAALDDKQLQLKTRESGLEHRRQQLRDAKSNKEYQALKDQIAADEEANGVMEVEVLETMERFDKVTAEVAAAKGAVEKARDEARKTQQEYDRLAPTIQAETDRLQAELRQGEAELAIDFRDAYARLVRQKGSEALAPVHGEFCGGCNQHVPLHMVDAVKLSKPSFCKSCGRLLYLPEGA